MAKGRVGLQLGIIVLLSFAGSAASALIINLSATTTGCNECAGGLAGPGTVQGAIVTLINPVQVTLGPGTYVITNAATVNGVEPGANPNFLAYNFQAGNPSGWAWSFLVATDNGNGTGTMLKFDYAAGTNSTQLGKAGETGIVTGDYSTILPSTTTAGFIDTLVLGQTTVLDFFIDDYYLPDNDGGVAIKIVAMPEPRTIALFASAVVSFFALRSVRRSAR